MSEASDAKPTDEDDALPSSEGSASARSPAGASTEDTAEAPAPDKPKKKKKKARRGGNLDSRRGIDTLFRTTYREQLELTALADSKANIMIQLNGVIVSIMLASSGVIVEAHPWLRLPSAALTLTSLVSIVFAVLAARPNLKKPSALRFEDIRNGKANILFFGNFARLSEDEFVEGMWEMFGESEQVYLNMTRHVHGLGSVLLRKFRLLRVAYTVFLAGLFVSAALFLFTRYVVPSDPTPQPGAALFNQLQDMYEPSGVVQLPDGRVLAVEDEPERPLALMSLSPPDTLRIDNSVDLRALLERHDPSLAKLDDLEGAAIDPKSGHVYVVTSFSGKSKPAREKLVRFQLQNGELTEPRIRTDLRPSLTERLGDRINIEALAFDASHDRLLLGLRSPLRDNQALVVPIDGAGAMFEGPLQMGEPIALDMQGAGIRGMSYDPELGGFVIIGHREGSGHPFALWLWDGEDQPRRLSVQGVVLRTAEGVAPVVLNGHKRLLIVNDDGIRSLGTAASYILLRYDQLSEQS